MAGHQTEREVVALGAALGVEADAYLEKSDDEDALVAMIRAVAASPRAGGD